MMLFNILGLVLTLFLLLNGLFYLYFKKNKNKVSSVLGLFFLVFGFCGLFIILSL
jgi:hypothetical protein